MSTPPTAYLRGAEQDEMVEFAPAMFVARRAGERLGMFGSRPVEARKTRVPIGDLVPVRWGSRKKKPEPQPEPAREWRPTSEVDTVTQAQKKTIGVLRSLGCSVREICVEMGMTREVVNAILAA